MSSSTLSYYNRIQTGGPSKVGLLSMWEGCELLWPKSGWKENYNFCLIYSFKDVARWGVFHFCLLVGRLVKLKDSMTSEARSQIKDNRFCACWHTPSRALSGHTSTCCLMSLCTPCCKEPMLAHGDAVRPQLLQLPAFSSPQHLTAYWRNPETNHSADNFLNSWPTEKLKSLFLSYQFCDGLQHYLTETLCLW